MAAVKSAIQVAAGLPLLSVRDASAEYSQISEYAVPAGGLALNDIIEMGAIPEFCVFTGVKVYCEDLDTGTTVTLTAGVLSGTYNDTVATGRTNGGDFFVASTVGQAGGTQSENKATGLFTAVANTPTPYGITVAAAPTGQNVGARIRMKVSFKAAPPLMA